MTTCAPELLAPAGQPAALDAALAAGADAVYFGLKQLNARRGAANFSADSLPDTLQKLHEHGRKGYLTLNIDLAQRELGQAVRAVELARQAKVDGILVRDAALLPLVQLLPEIAFHFSTQAAVTSSAGVRAAHQLGIRRVVLARELSLAEIRAASAVPGVETELFVQGALCFCCSGRCLLSSWVGGRSGNRGACTSPCRVPWSVAESAPEKPLSMHDLCALERLDALRQTGVASLKIEGRLKSPAWVARATRLYRQALDHGVSPELLAEAASLGAYTGRRLTTQFLDGKRDDLTGDSARPATVADAAPAAVPEVDESPANPYAITIRMTRDDKDGLLWGFHADGWAANFRTPPQQVRNPRRAIALCELRDRFAAALPRPWTLAGFELAGDPHQLLPPTAANQIEDELLKQVRRAAKPDDGTIRAQLPEPLKLFLQPAPSAPHPANRKTLGDPPNQARLDAAWLPAFARSQPTVTLLAEFHSRAELDAVPESLLPRLIPALPHVFYEEQIPALTDLLDRCRELKLTVEVNGWDGWWLANAANVSFIGGPGLMVLNGHAANALHELGCASVTLSLEADGEQLADVCRTAAAPLRLTVFGRPPLMQTRVEFPATALANGGACFRDSREGEMRPRREGAVTVFRPTQPFNLCGLRLPTVRAAQLIADLQASPDPVAEFRALPRLPGTPFNLNRTLR